jgi:hypothetical protein
MDGASHRATLRGRELFPALAQNRESRQADELRPFQSAGTPHNRNSAERFLRFQTGEILLHIQELVRPAPHNAA